jgi:hypothetical protein
MFWLIGPLIVVAVLFIAGFRKTASAVLVAAVAAAAWLYTDQQRVRQLGLESISASEIVLQDVTVRRTFDETYELSGRIVNRSTALRVTGISVEVKLQDCPRAPGQACREIGDAIAHIPVTVDPQDERQVGGALYYGKGAAPAKDVLTWSYKLVGVRTSPR